MKKKGKIILAVCSVCAVLAVVFVLIGVLGGKEEPQAKLRDGVITLGDAQLSFGENALSDGDATLIEKGTDSDIGLVTGLYALELESVCDKSVSLSVPVQDIASADEGTVSLGIGKDFKLSTGETETLYTYAKATVKDGVATAEFTPSEYAELTTYLGASGDAASEDSGKLRLYLGFFSQNSTYLENGHFEVWFPCGLKFKEANRKLMLDELEKMYEYYTDIGYDCTSSGKQTIILQRKLKEEGYYSWKTGEIVLNAKEFDDSEFDSRFIGTMKPILYHEFFHKIQDNYITVYGINLWFCEATASYYEAKQLGQTYTGALNESNFPLQFESILPAENTDEAGYARASLVWYISSRNGNDEWILNLFKNKTIADSYIEGVMSDVSVTFATEYYTALTCNTIGNKPAMVEYNDIVKGRAKDNVGVPLALSIPKASTLDDIMKNGGSTVIGEKTITLSGTGARYFALQIDKSDAEKIPDGAEISVSCEGGLPVTVKVKGKDTELYGESLGGFKEAVKDGYYYLVLAYANGAKGKAQSVTLTVTLTAEPKQVFNRIKASPDYNGSGNDIRAALFAAGKAEIDKNGNFKMALSSYSNGAAITDFEVNGKVDFSTMKITATLSFRKSDNYSGDSLNTAYKYPDDGLYYRCESIVYIGNTSGELRGGAVEESGEWRSEYWSSGTGTTTYTVPPRQDPDNPEIIYPGFSWSDIREAGEYKFNLSLDFVLFNE